MLIPERILESLKAYVEEKRPTGGFLQAVLENNLSEAFGRADEENRKCLFEIVSYVYNELPAPCWGSPGKVKEWLAEFPEPIPVNTHKDEDPELTELNGEIRDCGDK